MHFNWTCWQRLRNLAQFIIYSLCELMIHHAAKLSKVLISVPRKSDNVVKCIRKLSFTKNILSQDHDSSPNKIIRVDMQRVTMCYNEFQKLIQMWGCQMIVSDSAQTSTTTVTYPKSIQNYKEFMTTRCTAVLLLTKSRYGRFFGTGNDKVFRATVILRSTQHKGIPSAKGGGNFYKNILDSFLRQCK